MRGLSDGCLANHTPGTLGNNNHGQHVVCINVMRFHFSTTAPIIRRKTRPDRHNVRIKINNIIMINVRLQHSNSIYQMIQKTEDPLSPRIVLSLIKPLIHPTKDHHQSVGTDYAPDPPLLTRFVDPLLCLLAALLCCLCCCCLCCCLLLSSALC